GLERSAPRAPFQHFSLLEPGAVFQKSSDSALSLGAVAAGEKGRGELRTSLGGPPPNRVGPVEQVSNAEVWRAVMPRVVCPSCQKSGNAPQEYMTRRVRCSGCGVRFVPQPPNVYQQPAPQTPLQSEVEPEDLRQTVGPASLKQPVDDFEEIVPGDGAFAA